MSGRVFVIASFLTTAVLGCGGAITGAEGDAGRPVDGAGDRPVSDGAPLAPDAGEPPADAPGGTDAALPADDAGPWLTIAMQVDLAAPGSGQSGLNQDLYAPRTWGYMDPMIVVMSEDQYAIASQPCDLAAWQHYCLTITRNGVPYSETLRLSEALLPAGYAGVDSYQPPMLFLGQSEILVAYWVYATNTGDGTARSFVNLVAVPTGYPAGTPAPFTHRTTYTSSGGTFNYLGGAMGPSGDIVVAGFRTDGPQASMLQLIRFAAPAYASTEEHVAGFWSSLGFLPLYPHVVIRDSGLINVFAVATTYQVCTSAGYGYGLYKTVFDLEGTFGGTFTNRFQDASSDATAANNFEGDPCDVARGRFPLTSILDRSTDTVYLVYRQQDGGPPIYDRTFPVVAVPATGPAVTAVADLAPHFGGPFASVGAQSGVSTIIDAVSMTKLDNGRFVFFANNRGDWAAGGASLPALLDFSVVATRDFATFTEPVLLSPPWGPGHHIHAAQAGKNGMAAMPKLHFFHTGNMYNVAHVLDSYRYRYYRASVAP
jgi:hypothetical protein